MSKGRTLYAVASASAHEGKAEKAKKANARNKIGNVNDHAFVLREFTFYAASPACRYFNAKLKH
jgi:hypothetical protein